MTPLRVKWIGGKLKELQNGNLISLKTDQYLFYTNFAVFKGTQIVGLFFQIHETICCDNGDQRDWNWANAIRFRSKKCGFVCSEYSGSQPVCRGFFRFVHNYLNINANIKKTLLFHLLGALFTFGLCCSDNQNGE